MAGLRAGGWVEVNGTEEVLATLESEELDALPFMLEMLRYFGKRKSAHTNCDTLGGGGIRRMPDAVLLEGLRGDRGRRRARREARATIAAVVLLGAARLQAQTLPLPALPAAAPTTLVETAPLETQRWEYALGFAAGYDTNVVFGPEATGDAVVTPLGGLVRVFPGTKGQLRIQGFGRGSLYAEQGSQSHIDADVGVQGSRLLSTNVNLAGGVDAGLAHTNSYTILGAQGVLLPLSQMRVLQGSADLEWRLGTRSEVRFGTSYNHSDFEVPELVDSATLRATFTVDRRLGGRNTLLGYYAFERSDLGSSYSTHYGSGQWSFVMSERNALLVEGGISYTARAADSGLASGRNFYGGAAFLREIGRSRVVLFARREVLPAFGVGGLRLSDRIGLRATVPIGRVWQLDLAARHVECSDVCAVEDGTDNNELSDEATVALGRTLGRRYVLAGQVRYRRRSPTGTVPAIEGVQAALVLSFSNPRAGDLWVWTASPLFGPARFTD